MGLLSLSSREMITSDLFFNPLDSYSANTSSVINSKNETYFKVPFPNKT